MGVYSCVCACVVCVRYFNTIFIQVASERNLYDPGDDSVSFAFYLLLQLLLLLLLLLPSWCVVFFSLFSFYFYSKHVLCAEVERGVEGSRDFGWHSSYYRGPSV